MEETDQHKDKKSNVSTEYFGVFPTVLFLCSDYTPMHFVLSLKDIPEEGISKIVGLMQHCGADVTLNVNEAADYSIVISDHNDGLDFYGPTFHLEFVKECLDKLKVLDISKYRLHGNVLPKDANCMDVVYYKRLGWKALIHQQNKSSSNLNFEHMDIFAPMSEDDYSKEESMEELTKNYENINELDDNERNITKNRGENTSKEKSRKVLSPHKGNEDVINNEENFYSDESLLESCSRKYKKLQPLPSTSKTADKWLFTFDSDDDDDDDKQKNIDNSKKRDFSEEIEKRKKKKQKHNLNNEETIYSDESLFESCPSRNKTAPVAAPASCSQTSNKWRFLNEFCSSDNDDDDDDNHQPDVNSSVKQSNEEEQVKADVTGNSNCTKTNKPTSKPPEVVTKSAPKRRFFDYGFGSDDSDAKPTEINRCTKRSRLPYTDEERVKILEYITAHNEYGRIKGRDLWIIMERRKVCPSRTWQSMKEHFLKKVLRCLDEFTFLTNSQKFKIRNVCF